LKLLSYRYILILSIAILNFINANAQYKGHRKKDEWEFGGIGLIYGNVKMDNDKLNQYLIAHGGSPANIRSEMDLALYLFSTRWRIGANIGGVFNSNSANSVKSFLGDCYVGRSIFQSHKVQANLNGHLVVLNNSIDGIVPSFVQKTNPEYYLLNTEVGTGISLLGFVRLWELRNEGRFTSSVLLGAEIGVSIITTTHWKYGNAHDGFITAYEVPYLDNQYEYSRVWLVWSFSRNR